MYIYMNPQLQPFPKLGTRFLTEEENRERMSKMLDPDELNEDFSNVNYDIEEEEKRRELKTREESDI